MYIRGLHLYLLMLSDKVIFMATDIERRLKKVQKEQYCFTLCNLSEMAKAPKGMT